MTYRNDTYVQMTHRTTRGVDTAHIRHQPVHIRPSSRTCTTIILAHARFMLTIRFLIYILDKLSAPASSLFEQYTFDIKTTRRCKR